MSEKNINRELAQKVVDRMEKVGKTQALAEFVMDTFSSIAILAKDDEEMERMLKGTFRIMKENHIPKEVFEMAIKSMEKSIEVLGGGEEHDTKRDS